MCLCFYFQIKVSAAALLWVIDIHNKRSVKIKNTPGRHGHVYEGDGSGRSRKHGFHRCKTGHGDFSGVLRPNSERSAGGNGAPGSV